jgi:hypothetical protein
MAPGRARGAKFRLEHALQEGPNQACPRLFVSPCQVPPPPHAVLCHAGAVLPPRVQAGDGRAAAALCRKAARQPAGMPETPYLLGAKPPCGKSLGEPAGEAAKTAGPGEVPTAPVSAGTLPDADPARP